MLRDMVREVAKATSNKITGPLFTIKLKHTTSVYFATVDERVVYGGEIYRNEVENDNAYLSLICSDSGQLLFHDNELKLCNLLIKSDKSTYIVQTHYSIVDINTHGNMWDIGIKLTKPQNIVKI